METFNLKEFTNFLNIANKCTYAANGKKVVSSRLKSDDFEYKRGGWAYHDTYFGEQDFIGEEVVYKNNVPVWGANYYGFILDDAYAPKQVYVFLKKSLMQESDNIIPVRGPKTFKDDGWVYNNYADGELDNFSGKEEILFGNRVVYRCLYHGGFVR
ncbi:MAG: XRE family transcriptional regulator [Parcubacteria group bacterium]|nr:MAG: XRE family transcriptional regulator [Parcubacteria group bacterium]